MIAAGLTVPESFLSISMINYSIEPSCGCGLAVNNCSSGNGLSGLSPCMGEAAIHFNFSINDHSKYQNAFFIFELISKKKYSIILKLYVILYITLISCCDFTHFNQPTHFLTLLLIVTGCHHSGSL